MKITVNIALCTDGDFYVDCDNFKRDIVDLPEYNEICSSMDEVDLDEADFSLAVSFTTKQLKYCRISAVDVLASVLTNIRILYTHYLIMEDLFNAFDGAIRAIYAGKNYFNSISGNYVGTFVEVVFEEECENE